MRQFAELASRSPRDHSAHNNLGVLLRKHGQAAAAEVCLRRAIALAPAVAAYRSNLGNALRDLRRYDEAVVHLTEAAALDPAATGYVYNLALALRDCGRWADALTMLEDLSGKRPDDPEIAWDLALSRLSGGDLIQGFEGYEARLRLDRFPRRDLPGERWRGEPMVGKTLFVHAEQGFGDMIQFVRFVPQLVDKGARVILECDPALAPLFVEIEGVAQVVGPVGAGKAAPPYDLWVPMGSLPRILGVDAATLSAQCFPYLKTSRHLTKPLPKPPGTRLAVGLVWAGKARPKDRSWPLEVLLPLLHDPELAFFSLQVGPRSADLAKLGVDGLVMDVGAQVRSFADTAAVMAGLDLLISVDSAPAHLAGALGLPACILLHRVNDWRWGLDGSATPWYPSLELFRQTSPDDFAGPVAAVARRLKCQSPTRGEEPGPGD